MTKLERANYLYNRTEYSRNCGSIADLESAIETYLDLQDDVVNGFHEYRYRARRLERILKSRLEAQAKRKATRERNAWKYRLNTKYSTFT